MYNDYLFWQLPRCKTTSCPRSTNDDPVVGLVCQHCHKLLQCPSLYTVEEAHSYLSCFCFSRTQHWGGKGTGRVWVRLTLLWTAQGHTHLCSPVKAGLRRRQHPTTPTTGKDWRGEGGGGLCLLKTGRLLVSILFFSMLNATWTNSYLLLQCSCI